MPRWTGARRGHLWIRIRPWRITPLQEVEGRGVLFRLGAMGAEMEKFMGATWSERSTNP